MLLKTVLGTKCRISNGSLSISFVLNYRHIIKRNFRSIYSFLEVKTIMSRDDCKEKLHRSLNCLNAKVIVLTGPWGCGKTHLVNEERTRIAEKNGSDFSTKHSYLYTSLFGISTIDDIKKGLVLNKMTLSGETVNRFSKFVKSLLKGLGNCIPHGQTLKVVTDIQWLALAEKLLSNSIIILDDIERKEDSITIKELFGFIDKFTKKPYNCKFILIVNKEKISNEDNLQQWDIYKEKLVDEEIFLSITPKEAFDIAKKSIGTRCISQEQFDSLQDACTICEIKNIRVIRKIFTITEFLLSQIDQKSINLNSIAIRRLLPSIVLISGIYYHAFEKTIDLDKLTKISSDILNLGTKDTLDSKEDDTKYWKTLLHKLGIYFFDTFEHLLINFYNKGNLDINQLNALITQKEESIKKGKENNKIKDFIHDVYWNKEKSYDKLRIEAAGFQDLLCSLSPSEINTLINCIEQIPNTKSIQNKIFEKWKNNLNLEKQESLTFEFESYRPEIQATLKEYFNTHYSLTLPEVSHHICKAQGWGRKHEIFLNQLSATDLKKFIKSSTNKEFKEFLAMMHTIKGLQQFEILTTNFKEACQDIVDKNNPEDQHLIDIIKRLIQTEFRDIW